MAFAELKANNHKEALFHFNKYVETHASDPRGYYYRAIGLMHQMNYDQALNDLDHSISMYDEDADVYSERGVVYYHLGNSERSLNDLNKACSLEPENAYRYSSRAFIKDRAGDIAGAISDYEQALALDPEDAIIHNNLGLIYEKQGHVQKAQERFSDADRLFIDPEGNLRSQNELEKNDIGKSVIEPINNELSSKPGIGDYLKVMGGVFTSTKERNSFLGYIKRLLGIGKNSS